MRNAENKPHGVGGWLAVLVYWLIVIGPALGLLMLFGTISLQLQDSTLSPQVGSSQLLYLNVLDGVTWITQSGLSIYAGRRLRDRFEPASVRYAILILWFNSIGIAVLQFAALAVLSSSDPAGLALFFLGRSLVLVILVAVWNAYLVFSRRVKNTYYPAVAEPEEPSPQALVANAPGERPSKPNEPFVLYDERFDWLAMFLISFVPLWLAYSLKVGLILFPAFALIAALKPMRLRLGSLTWSGIFAAGACLLLSPLLLMAAQDSGSDLFDDVSVSDETLNGIRAFVYPFAGIAIMANAWFRAPRFRDANGSITKRNGFLRWLGFGIAGVVLVVNLLPRPQAEEVESAVRLEDRPEMLWEDDRFDRAVDAAFDALEAQKKLEETQVGPNDPLGALAPPTSPITPPNPSLQPLPSSTLSETELRELAASGWRDAYPDGDGCMIERVADDGLNFVMIYEGYTRPVIELSFPLDMDVHQWSPAELQTLVVQVDDHRIPARVQGVSKVPAEVEIPYTDVNRSRIARARLIALHLGPVQLARTAILPNRTSTEVIEACLQVR